MPGVKESWSYRTLNSSERALAIAIFKTSELYRMTLIPFLLATVFVCSKLLKLYHTDLSKNQQL